MAYFIPLKLPVFVVLCFYIINFCLKLISTFRWKPYSSNNGIFMCIPVEHRLDTTFVTIYFVIHTLYLRHGNFFHFLFTSYKVHWFAPI